MHCWEVLFEYFLVVALLIFHILPENKSFKNLGGLLDYEIRVDELEHIHEVLSFLGILKLSQEHCPESFGLSLQSENIFSLANVRKYLSDLFHVHLVRHKVDDSALVSET